MNKTIAALLPMRHSSERVPQKNYKEFNGKPLFHWVLGTLDSCPSIASIVINTDSPLVKEQAPCLSGKVRIIDRPENLRDGAIPMNEIIAYDLARVEADLFLQTHTTNPLLKAETIGRAVDALLASGEHDSLFSVTRWQTRFWDQDTRPVNHDMTKLLRTQDLPPMYEENSNIYIFSAESFLKQKNRIGERPLMFEIPKEEAYDINDASDFLIAETLHRKLCLEGQKCL
jgi:CMP-N-acetylneuraminic acid synthetase